MAIVEEQSIHIPAGKRRFLGRSWCRGSIIYSDVSANLHLLQTSINSFSVAGLIKLYIWLLPHLFGPS
jgi:hypothetical protein